MGQLDWKSRYAGKVRTAAEAIRTIAPGRRILIGSGAAEPATLVEAMVVHGEHLADNEIIHMLTLGPAPYVQPGMERRFRHTAPFIGKNVREAVHEGRADFLPVFLSEIPRLFRSRRIRIDVALIQVSPPDDHGYTSLGVSVDVVRAAVDSADLVIAEVNPRMPRTLGDSFIHIDRIHHVVAVDAPLPELDPVPPDEVSREIGRHVATLIPDGATLQMGIGGIPNAVLSELSDRRDLGVHTEMLPDAVVDLVQAGVITGRRKTLLPGKIVTSFIMGSRRLYEWAHDNPAIEMRPSDFTNDPLLIARNDHMIAINAALAVDLTGQVASDTLMGRFFSGIGGQVDFIRGAARSREGRAIIALPSTAKQGAFSRIHAAFEEGAGVVTSRGDVHYVVTEYGVADLWGKNIRQRAMSLIEIAHPDFRPDLLAAAKGRRYVFPDQVVPRARVPWEEAGEEVLPDGTRILVRPLRTSDADPLQDLFYGLSDDSIYRRFLAYKRTHPHEEMQRLVDLDYEQNMALVACSTEGGVEDIVGLTRYDVLPATQMAEIAFVVRDAWQGRGVGSVLMQRMCEIGRARGLRGFVGDLLVSNTAMLYVFQHSGLEVQADRSGDVVHLTARFVETDRAPAPETTRTGRSTEA